MNKRSKNLFLSVSLQEKILFAKHLSMALKAGKPIIDSVELIRSQTSSSSMRAILDEVMDDLKNGQFLSYSLERHKRIFGDLFINIVRIGESSGTLVDNLLYIADELKKKQELRRTVRGALIYPAVILVATLGIATGMIVFIFPKILPVFASLRVELPITTRILIVISNVMKAHGLLLFIGIVGGIVGLVFLSRMRAVKYWLQFMILHLPMFKSLAINFNIANITRTLGLLLKTGMKIVEAINITADTMSSLVYQNELKRVGREVGKGEYISKYLSHNQKLFPIIVTNMIEVGENTGNLTDNLFYLSDFYKSEVDAFVKNLSSIIEPILMVVMGTIVGFIALAVITPIYQITQTLTR